MFALSEALTLAAKHFQASRDADAEQLCRQILQSDPGNIDSLFLLGLLANRGGDNDRAGEFFRKVLELKPDHVEAHNNLGLVLQQLGRLEDAEASLRDCLRLKPSYAEGYNNLGLVLRESEKLLSAEESLRHALILKPDYVEAQFNLGITLQKQEKLESARQCYEKLLRLKPDHLGACINLGSIFQRQGELAAALAIYEQILCFRPDCPEGHNNRGYVLQLQGAYPQAEASYAQAIRLKPNYTTALNNLRAVLLAQGKLAEVEEQCHVALSRNPDFAEAHYDLAHTRLLQGDLTQGWAEYEWRWRLSTLRPRAFPQPKWQGETLNGRTILIHAEQGAGDTLQFVRFVPQVKARGGTVLLECQPTLARILKDFPGTQRVLSTDDPLPQFDVHAPLLSLPYLLGIKCLEQLASQMPYVQPDPTLVQHWKVRLEAVPGLRIGIAWAENSTERQDPWRSNPFSQLAEMVGISLIGLLRGSGTDQTGFPAGVMLDLGPKLTDMADAAAVLMNLDLVITADTALAQLAGALGVPTWVAVPFAPHWRWLVGRDDNPWYPSLRLFRQRQPVGWDDVFASMKEALQEHLAKLGQSVAVLSAADAFTLATRYYHGGNCQQAERLCQRVLRECPQHVEASNLLGLIAHRTGNDELASEYFRQILRGRPNHAEARYNLGCALREQGKLKDAEHSLREAGELRPDYSEAHNNLGIVLLMQGTLIEAEERFERALRLKPDYAEAHHNRANLWLLCGNLAKGWAEYEWRWRLPNFSPRSLAQPLWRGEPLAGRTILLHAEQGLGDMLQFVRFIPQVKARGGQVLLECQPSLERLLGRCEWIDGLTIRGERAPPFDVHAPLLSLPYLLGINALERIPAQPYLEASPALVRYWKQRLDEFPGLRVGIVWRGSPKHPMDRWRSVPPRMFATLADLNAVSLISLQKGASAEQIRQIPGLAADLGPELSDMADTAAVVKNLDLVITVDTAVAHLGGALGVPTWVALSTVPEWRWLLEREDSPWYPSVRLFRQTEPENWSALFARMKRHLLERLSTTQAHFSMSEIVAIATDDYRKGNLDQAEKLCQQVLQRDPRHVAALKLLGLLAHRLGNFTVAARYFHQVLSANPDDFEAHNNLGAAQRGQGMSELAQASWRQAIALKPNYVKAHLNLGLTQLELGKLPEAIESLRRVALLEPNNSDAHNNLGVALQTQGNVAEALICYQQALSLKPDCPEAHNNLGNGMLAQRKLAEAEGSYRQALRINSDYAEAHIGLGCVLMQQDKLADAADSIQRALRLRPDSAEALNNMALILREQGQYQEALALLQRALHLSPNYANAHILAGMLWLLQGEFTRGWTEYEWRHRLPPAPRSFSQPTWQGEPLNGRTILLHAEQGLGDTIHFLRYAALVKTVGRGVVLLECQPALARLLKNWPGADRILVQGDPLLHFDVHAPLLNLPRLLGTSSLELIPADMPYLHVDTALILAWRKRMESTPGFRIGIAWQGNPDHLRDRKRSVSLERFVPLADLDGVSLVSLQIGPGSEQLAKMPGKAVNMGQFDIADTAAVVMNLDLVITVDTALAHLAGALGAPVWVALSAVPDWRWLLDRDDSPWYPSMRLFRQPRPQEWDEVFAKIRAKVRDTLFSLGIGS